MANERGHPKLAYEVWKINFHAQVAKENKLFPFVICQTKLSLAASLGTGNVASQSFSYG